MKCKKCGSEIGVSKCPVCGCENNAAKSESGSNWYGAGVSEAAFSADMQYDIAKRLIESGNYEEAEQWLQLPAKKGNVAAQYLLGQLYENFDTRKDLAKALFFYNQAASRGNTPSIFALIRLYGSEENYNRDKLQYWKQKSEASFDDRLDSLRAKYENQAFDAVAAAVKSAIEEPAVEETMEDEEYVCNPADYEIENGVLLRYNGEDEWLRLPNGITEIGNYAFEENMDITMVIIPEGVTTIGACAFNGCFNLEYVSLPSTLKTIKSFAFSGTCLHEIELPEGLESLGEEHTFADSALNELTIPGGVSTVPLGCFSQNSFLETVVLQNGVERIDAEAFEGCEKLHTVMIPNSVREIVVKHSSFKGAFSGCSALRTVIASGSWKCKHAAELAAIISNNE